MSAISVDDYLLKFVEGYLFGDLARLEDVQPLHDGRGACLYPMLFTIVAGIELLGSLDLAQGESSVAFDHFWSEYLYQTGPRRAAGRSIYSSVRNGLAHCFMPKAPMELHRDRALSDRHLTTYDGRTILELCRFAADLRAAYEGPYLDRREAQRSVRQGRLDRTISNWLRAPMPQYLPSPSPGGSVTTTPNSLSATGHIIRPLADESSGSR